MSGYFRLEDATRNFTRFTNGARLEMLGIGKELKLPLLPWSDSHKPRNQHYRNSLKAESGLKNATTVTLNDPSSLEVVRTRTFPAKGSSLFLDPAPNESSMSEKVEERPCCCYIPSLHGSLSNTIRAGSLCAPVESASSGQTFQTNVDSTSRHGMQSCWVKMKQTRQASHGKESLRGDAS